MQNFSSGEQDVVWGGVARSGRAVRVPSRMSDAQNSEHRAQEWGTIGGVLFGAGLASLGALIQIGESSHLWSDDAFLVGLAFACLLAALGVYALLGAFVRALPLPATLREREERRHPAPRRPASSPAPTYVIVDAGPPRWAKRPRRPKPPKPADPAEQAVLRAVAARRKSRERATRQLVATVKSGNVLRVRGHGDGPLGVEWRDEVMAMVKQSAGERQASAFEGSQSIDHRLQCLRELARRLPGSFAASESWDAYVDRMTTFRQALDALLAEGERLRTELSSKTLDAEPGAAKTEDWMHEVDESFEGLPLLRERLHSRLGEGLRNSDGISEVESESVWRLSVHLEALQPLRTVVVPYVEALRGGQAG
jgi:hypothetical protein